MSPRAATALYGLLLGRCVLNAPSGSSCSWLLKSLSNPSMEIIACQTSDCILGRLNRRARVPRQLRHPTSTQHVKLLGSEVPIGVPCAKLRFTCERSHILELEYELENTEDGVFPNEYIVETQGINSHR